jgi:hypothetical protein
VSARLRASPDHQHVSVKSPNSLKQRLLDGPDSDPNGRLGANSSLQIGNELTCLRPFLRLNLLFEIQLNG